MMTKTLTKRRMVILLAVISAVVILLFIDMPVKTVKANYNVYENKIEFRGIYFAQEYILLEGDIKTLKIKYKDGERVPKGASISSGIKASESGIVIKHLDEYENKYNLENVKNVNQQEINKIIDNNDTVQGLKILNNAEWYIYAFVEQADFLRKGRTFELMINEKYYLAEVSKVYDNADGKYVIFKLKSDLKTIDLHRGLTGYIIKSRYNGMILPSSAITEYKGAKGVFINYNGYAEFRKLKIVYEEDDTAIVNPDPSSRRKLQQHDDVITKPEDLEEGIKIR